MLKRYNKIDLMTPKVSIIVPCYKVEQYLDRCVESLIRQSLDDIEIILVDDGSPDSVPEMCDRWAERDTRIRVVHKKNEGLGMACNSGLEIATGEYVAFVDSDDWVEPETYETMYNSAQKYNAQIVFCGIRRVNEKGEKTAMYRAKTMTVYDTPEKIAAFSLDMIASEPSSPIERRIPMSAKIVLYERKKILENNIRFENEKKFISEDLIFNLDCLSYASCIVEISEIYYNYFINQNSITQTFHSDRFVKIIDLRNELLSRYHDMPADFTNRVNRMTIGYVRKSLCKICLSPQLSENEKKAMVNEICTDSLWEQIRNAYPIKIMPVKHRLFLVCVLMNNYFLINLLARLNRQ